LLHNFSANAHPLEQDRSYSKFHFIGLVEHGGHFENAARALRNQGYGRPYPPTVSRRRRRGSQRYRSWFGTSVSRPRPSGN
jgi:hypothetical protein